MYFRYLLEAIRDYPNQPARAAKIRGIRREAKQRLEAERLCASALISDLRPTLDPTTLYVLPPAAKGRECIFKIGRIRKYGARQCQKMLNRPLPFVTAYDPQTDPDWPTA